MQNYKKTKTTAPEDVLQAHTQLAAEIDKGRRSGEEEGYLSIEEVKALLAD